MTSQSADGAASSSTASGNPALRHASAVVTPRIHPTDGPGRKDRTRAAMDAVLGGLRPGCGQVSDTTRGTAGRSA